MQKLIRKIHLSLGLIVTPFLLFYALSATLIAHHSLYPSYDRKEVIRLQLSEVPDDPTTLVHVLARDHGIRGKLTESGVDADGSRTLTIERPGESHRLVIDPATGAAESSVSTPNLSGFLIALHGTAGMTDKPAQETLWGAAILVVSVGIVGVVITGFLLWLRQKKTRRAGGLFLGASALYCIVVLTVIRMG